MRAFVFTDPALARHAGQFVWLEIDSENPKNAAFLEQFPIDALPTFLIVDPAPEKVALRWVGGASVQQLGKILEDGRVAAGSGGAGSAAGRALERADRLYGKGDNPGAVKAYREALAAAPEGWKHYARAVESLLYATQRTDDNAAAATLARAAYPKLRGTSSAASVAGSGLACALALPVDDPRRAGMIAALEADAREVVANAALPVAADDRSSLFGSLVDARHDARDEAGARKFAERWAAFLEGEAGRASTPDGRAVFDSHRLAVYLELGAPERAVPMLEASERDFPNDYNPPARLAIAYNAMKRWDDALAATNRALARAYGPRKLRIFQARTDAFTGRGDRAAARRSLEEAVAYAQALPPGQRSESSIASLRKRLDALK